MLTQINPYSDVAVIATKGWGNQRVVGYRYALRQFIWCTAQAEAWFGQNDAFNASAHSMCYVDVLPLASRPDEYRKPVFMCEARREAFDESSALGKGELLAFLLQHITLEEKEGGLVSGAKKENLFLLSDRKVAVVHWLPGYTLWQVHVTEDQPYLIDPGTRIFTMS